MGHRSGAFVGIDTSKLRNAVAVAEEGRGGDLRYLGEIDTTEAATRKLVTKLAAKYSQLTFCYEAGPTGYGLHRLIGKLGHDCIVAAPSLISRKPGVRVRRCEIFRALVRQRGKTSGASASKSPRLCFGSDDIFRARRRGARPT